MSRRTPTLKDRAALYAAKKAGGDEVLIDVKSRQQSRWSLEKAWLDGYQAAMRRRAKRR